MSDDETGAGDDELDEFAERFTVDEPQTHYSYRTSERAYGDIDMRAIGLRHAVSYFAYVRRVDGAAVRATVVLEMAQHFADWLDSGVIPTTGD